MNYLGRIVLFVFLVAASIVENAYACEVMVKGSSSGHSSSRSRSFEYEFSESKAKAKYAFSDAAMYLVDTAAASPNDKRAVRELLRQSVAIRAKTKAVLDEVEQVVGVLIECCNQSVDSKTLMALNDLTLNESPTLDAELQKAKYHIQQIIYESSFYIFDNGSGKFRGITSSGQSSTIMPIVRGFSRKVAQWKSDPVQAYYDFHFTSASRPYNVSWAQRIKNHHYNQDLRKLIMLCEKKDFGQAFELLQKYRNHYRDELDKDYALLERVYVTEKVAHDINVPKLELKQQIFKNAGESVEKLKNDADSCNLVQEDNPRFMNRVHALEEASKNPELTFKEYQLTQAGSSLLSKAGLQEVWSSSLSGNALQQVMQAELVSLINSAGALRSQQGIADEVKDLSGILVTFAHVGNYCNRTGALDKAFVIIDFCWALLDCCLAAGEGALQGDVNIGNALLDPVVTVKSLREATLRAGYCLGKIITTIIAEDDFLERNPEECRRHWPDRDAQIVAVADFLHNKLEAIPTRTIIKEMSAFTTKTWLTRNILKVTRDFLHVAVNRSRMLVCPPKDAERIEYKAALQEALSLELAIAQEAAQNVLPKLVKKVTFYEKVDYAQRVPCKNHEIPITHSVDDEPCIGSMLRKKDASYAFDHIFDTYAGDARAYNLANKRKSHIKELHQIEGSLEGIDGIFEWQVESFPDGKQIVSDRRFIKGGTVTGIQDTDNKN